MFLSVNYNHKGKMPSGMTPDESKEWWNVFNGGFANQDLTVEEFIAAIQAGHAYTTQHNRYRKADNFIQGQHIALDLDTEDERSTFDYLMRDLFIANHAAFLHTTPSHRPDAPRCRVVFVLDRPIRCAEKYTLLAESLVYRFGLADRKCKDAARLFFGSEGCQVLQLDNILTLETAASELVKPYRDYLAKREAEHRQRLATMQVVSANDVPEKILEAHARTLLDRVQNAPDGDKYGTLRDISRTFGGYVGGGYYNRLDVEQWLQAAISANPNNVKDLQTAYRAISQGIEYGISDPLFFEMRQPAEQAPLDTVTPALTAEQREQVEAIIADISEREYWRGYHDAMTAEQREKWHRLGFKDSAIDYFGLGYAPINKSTGEIIEALTVPFYGPDGEVVNIEYRPENGGISYEYDLMPPLFFTDGINKGPVLLFDDSLQAVFAYLNYGEIEIDGQTPTMAGMPYLTIVPETLADLEGHEVIVILGPNSDPAGRGFKHLKGRAKVLRLPFGVDRLATEKIKPISFEWMVNTARKWA